MTSKIIESFGAKHSTPRGSSYLKTPEGMMQKSKVYEFLAGLEGPSAYSKVAEAMSTSDFDYLLTSDMNAQLMNSFSRWPVSYPMWTRAVTVNDFKSNPMPALEGPRRILQTQEELAGLTKTYLGESNYTIQLETRSDSIELSRQAIINDALGAFNMIPEKLGEAAAMTGEYVATSMIADSSGADATLFTEAHNNLMTTELSVAGVKEAAILMAQQVDDASMPIYNRPRGLIVPPELEEVAKAIVSAISIETLETNTRQMGANPYSNLQVAVNPWITSISSSNDYAEKQWYMYSDPNIGRPAVAFATLQGAPTPRIFRKTPDSQIIGGGLDGYSFENNSVEYKVSWDLAAAQIDYRGMVASQPES